MTEKFNDLIQVLKTLPAREGAELVAEYRASELARPSPWSDFWYGGSQGPTTFAGNQVNERSALQFPPVYAAVRRISSSIASLPLNLYRLSGRSKNKATEHPLWRILHRQPNPEMTSVQYREAMMLHLLLWGNHYSQIQRKMGWVGDIQALWPLDPSRMTPKRENGMLVYKYNLSETGQTITFPSWEILHVAGLSFNGLVGMSPIGLMRESVGLGLAEQEFSSRFYSNGATFSGVLETDGTLGDDAIKDLRKWFRDTYGGVSKAHEIAIFQQGLKFNPTSMPQKDAQYLEGREFSIRDVARCFDMPPRMLGDTSTPGWAKVEEQNQEFLTYTLLPHIVKIDQGMEIKFDLGPEYEIRHMMAGFLRGDSESRAAFYEKGIMSGWMVRNEAREWEDLNPIDGLDTPLEPRSNAAPADSPNKNGNGKDKKLDKEAFRMMAARLSRIEKKELVKMLGVNDA